MKVVRVPQDYGLDPNPVVLIDYVAESNSFKNKIELNCNVINFLLEGEKEVICRKSTKVTTDDLVFMRSGYWLMSEMTSETGYYKGKVLLFSNEWLIDFINKYDISVQRNEEADVVYIAKKDWYITSLFQSLEKVRTLNPASKDALLKVKLEELVMYLVQREGSEFIKCLLPTKDVRSVEFINLIEQNKYNKLTLQEIAFLCNMSPSTFKRQFIKHFGTSPMEWFRNQRLEYASWLLEKREKTPAEIGQEIGYATQSNFIKAFKKRFGVTPRQFQNSK